MVQCLHPFITVVAKIEEEETSTTIKPDLGIMKIYLDDTLNTAKVVSEFFGLKIKHGGLG